MRVNKEGATSHDFEESFWGSPFLSIQLSLNCWLSGFRWKDIRAEMVHQNAKKGGSGWWCGQFAPCDFLKMFPLQGPGTARNRSQIALD